MEKENEGKISLNSRDFVLWSGMNLPLKGKSPANRGR